MTTILVREDTEINGRKMYRGSTYAVSEDTAQQAIKANPRQVSLVTDSGPARRDKSIRLFTEK